MNIAVLIKQVPVSNDVSVDPETHALVRASSEGMVNPADLNAIEEAMLLKEQTGGKVVVFTMGPPDAEKSLRDAMALGCDESCLVTDRAVAGGDTVATAKVLAAAIRKYGEFDLILGNKAQGMKYDEAEADKIVAVKKFHDKRLSIKCALPAMISFNFGCNEPRLATLRTKRAAKNKPLETYTNADLGLPLDEVGIAGSPTAVVDSFSPKAGRKATMLNGTPAELAKKLKELIEEEKGK